MKRGRSDRILLTVGICPHLRSRLFRQKLLTRIPICEQIERALMMYLPKDDNAPVTPEPRQAVNYGNWIDYK